MSHDLTWSAAYPGSVHGALKELADSEFSALDGLGESTLRNLIGNDPEFAAHVLLNISKIPCLRSLTGT
jgi:hypothetical protein